MSLQRVRRLGRKENDTMHCPGDPAPRVRCQQLSARVRPFVTQLGPGKKPDAGWQGMALKAAPCAAAKAPAGSPTGALPVMSTSRYGSPSSATMLVVEGTAVSTPALAATPDGPVGGTDSAASSPRGSSALVAEAAEAAGAAPDAAGKGLLEERVGGGATPAVRTSISAATRACQVVVKMATRRDTSVMRDTSGHSCRSTEMRAMGCEQEQEQEKSSGQQGVQR